MEDLDGELFNSTYLRAAVSVEVLDENVRTVAEQLASLRLATAEAVPTVAGLVTLGLDPAAFVPGSYGQFVRYAGLDVDAEISDHVEMHGNLPAVLGQVEAKLMSLVETAVVDEAGFRQRDMPTYPFDALRGYVNRFGRGVGLVRTRLAASGNAPARYEITPEYWSVVLEARR